MTRDRWEGWNRWEKRWPLHVISPVAPLWQTFQDVITEAELVVSLAAVDALQSDPHQLVRVSDDLLLALQRRGKMNACVFASVCIKARRDIRRRCSSSPSAYVCARAVCVCVFSSSRGDLSLALYGVINITSTAQGCSADLGVAQAARPTTARRLPRVGGPPECDLVSRVWMLTSGLECWKTRSGRVRSCRARLTR